MSYLLYQDDNLVGVYDELQKAKDMAQGVMNNNWANNFKIVQYKLNTCLKVKTINIDNEIEMYDNDNEVENSSIESNDGEDIVDVQNQINLLKIQKEKIEESKNKYEVDLGLYYKFKKNLEDDINFVIPELFKDKYKIFHQLDLKNNLSWETFSLVYKEQDFHGKYSNIFEIANDFETKFLTNINSDTESESEADSDEDSNPENIIEIVQVLDSSEGSSGSD